MICSLTPVSTWTIMVLLPYWRTDWKCLTGVSGVQGTTPIAALSEARRNVWSVLPTPGKCWLVAGVSIVQIIKWLLSNQQASQASASADTSLEDLKELNPKQSPLDSLDQLYSALDSVFGERLLGDEVKANMRARSVSQWLPLATTHISLVPRRGTIAWERG